MSFTRLPDVDGYAPHVGFSAGFPVGADPRTGQAWLAHCYGMVGAGRGNDVPLGDRAGLEVIRTDTPTFAALVESRRNRRDDWYEVPAGHVELCNVPIVVRPMP